ncbi:MAG: FkbM family methyltransferase [Candidatus Sulfotelmatobacter sp.]
MSLWDRTKALLDRRGLRFAFSVAATHLARSQGKGVNHVFYDSGVWIHDTTEGYFAYHRPFVRLDMIKMDRAAQRHFFWGYRPQPGDTIVDVGAGVGEEALTFARAVGEQGKLICIEAHPRTYRCLEKMVQYNGLRSVIPVHVAVGETISGSALIEDSAAYLRNRLNAGQGISVPATTIDAIYRRLGLGRIQFLKMNIEGAERIAIRGMTETLSQTEVVCISCHDFLAAPGRDDGLRTNGLVKEFCQDHGFNVIDRRDPGIPSYLRHQVWGYSNQFIKIQGVSQLVG